MNKFFKVSLVAAAIAVTGTATAGTFTGNSTVVADVTANQNAVIFSTEGTTKLTGADLQLGPVVAYKLGAAYIVGDELIFTFSAGMDATKSKLPTNITVDTADFNLISATATVVKYRVVSGAAAVGSVFTLPQQKATLADISDSTKSGLVFSTTNIAGVTVAATATKNNGVDSHDADTTVGLANKLHLATSQFGTATIATKFNAVVDDSVAGASKKFVSGTNDAFAYTYTGPKVVPTVALLGKNDGVNNLTSAANSVAPIMTIAATLPFVDIAKYTVTSAAGGTVTSATNAGATDFTVTYPTGTTVPSDTVTITPKTGASAPVMGAYTFAASIASNGATVLATGVANAGAWSVTGSDVVEIPYMPYGTGLSQVIYATNKSVSDVEVSAKATDEAGTVYNLGVIGTASASSVTKLSTDIKNGLAAKGFTSGKVAIVLTFRGNSADVAANKIQVQSGYNANASDRGFVANSSNGSVK